MITGPDLARAREEIARTCQSLQAARIELRAPPPEPTTCCGRGCQGCVWEGYYTALGYWLEDAAALMRLQRPVTSS